MSFMIPELRVVAILVLLAAAAGCTPAVHYRAELARVRALEHDRELRIARIAELDLKLRHLERQGENLALERQSLSEERVQLLNELEELHQGNVSLQEELVKEREARQELTGTYQSLVEELEQEVESGKIEIHRLKGRLQVRALDRILFDSGKTEIKPEGREVLASVATQLKRIADHSVRVEGHTDNVPIATARFPSNWELSAARAVVVVRFLVDQGLDPAKLSAEGFGPHQPIAANDSSRGRARNRRIEIVLVPEGE